MTQMGNGKHLKAWAFRLILPILSAIFIITIFDFELIQPLVKQLSLASLILIVLISGLRPIFGGLRASVAYSKIDYLSVKSATKGYILSAYGGIFLPSSIGGDLLRIEHIKNCTNGLRRDALMVVTVERVIGFLALLITALLVSILVPSVSDFSLFFSITFFAITSSLILCFFSTKFLPLPDWVSRIFQHVNSYSDKMLLSKIFLLSVVFQIVSLSIPVLVAFVVSGIENAYQIAIITPAVAIFTTLPIAIGGLGIREAGYLGLGAMVNVPNEVSLLAGLSLSISIIISGIPGIIIQNELITINAKEQTQNLTNNGDIS